jgi:hypothetical protein
MPNTSPGRQGVASDGHGELTFAWAGSMGEQIVWR